MMLRPAPGPHHDDVVAQAEPVSVVLAAKPEVAGGNDAALRGEGDGVEACLQVASRLDLDKGYEVAAADDQVYLSERRLVAAGDNAVASKHQGKGSNGFGAMAAAFGLAPAPVLLLLAAARAHPAAALRSSSR